MTIQPSSERGSNAPLHAAVVGALLALLGAVQLSAALIYASQLVESDRNGGLFGFRVGMLMVIFVCVPAGLSGALSVAGGVGAALKKRWGYRMSMVASVGYVGLALLALWVALSSEGVPSGGALALFAGSIALCATVIGVMRRAMAASR